MTLTLTEATVELQNIESVIDALLKSQSIAEFCRAIVHSEFTENTVQGCHFFTLNSESTIDAVSGYGLPMPASDESLSAWSKNPIADCIRNKVFEFLVGSAQEKGVLAIPLLRDSIPVGVLGLVIDPSQKSLPIHEGLIPILSKLGTYCLGAFGSASANGQTNGFLQAPREANGEDLTNRQIQILGLMADGLVNGEIARELMLSESTIRQETVRIYRALGVPNRAEAAKKGRMLGLIKRPPPPRLNQLINDLVK